MATNYPINPRVRAFGKARIDIAARAKNPEDWEKLWKPPSNSFPFVWGETWKQCIEYRVDDFAAEVGFFIDILGLPINAFDPGYAMFTSPQGEFFFAVVPTPQSEMSTPPDSFRLQFMVNDVVATAQVLQSRGIFFEQLPQPLHSGSSLWICYFRTPHGISIELWGAVKPGTSPAEKMDLINNRKDQDHADGLDEDDDEFEEDDQEDDGDEDEIDEYDEDDELIEGEDDDANEDKFEDDEDEDEYGSDEASMVLKSKPQAYNQRLTQPQSKDTKAESQGKQGHEHNPQCPEYIVIDLP